MVFAKYGKRCFVCKSTRPPIQVHHLSYARLFNEPLSDLRPVCKKCHDELKRLHYKMGRRTTDGLTVLNTLIKIKRKA